MITLEKLVYDLKEAYTAAQPANQEPVGDRLITDWIHYTRAQLIRQDLQKGRTITDNIKQSLGCIDMLQVDPAMCCDGNTGCTVLKSAVQIPKAIEGEYNDYILRVGPPSITAKAFNLIPYERAIWSGNIPTTAALTKAFILDRYVYVINKKVADFYMPAIGVWIIAEDPTEVELFKHCDGTPCYTKSSNYPISATMVNTMKSMIKERDFRFIVRTSPDSKNDFKFQPDNQAPQEQRGE